VIWHSDTATSNPRLPYTLFIARDGRLQIEDSDGKDIWIANLAGLTRFNDCPTTTTTTTVINLVFCFHFGNSQNLCFAENANNNNNDNCKDINHF
jgi:hypothetical protein